MLWFRGLAILVLLTHQDWHLFAQITEQHIVAQRDLHAMQFHRHYTARIREAPDEFLNEKASHRAQLASLLPRDQPRCFLPSASFESSDDPTISQLSKDYAVQLERIIEQAFQEDFEALAFVLIHEAAFFGGRDSTSGIVSAVPTSAPTSRLSRVAIASLPWKRGEFWRISSTHFQVDTNLGEPEGLAICRHLEILHAAWSQLFFDFWVQKGDLQQAWRRGRPVASSRLRRMRVVLFANREEYVDYLRPRQPRIDITSGFYDVETHITYFFADRDRGDSALPTLFHEATHQLFQELTSTSAGQRTGWERNFWILEGVALYMESLRQSGPVAVLGGSHAERLQFARYRRLAEDFYVPLSELVRMGRDSLQNDARIAKIYSQGAGLTHFLMDSQHGRFRAPLIQYLRAVYTGHDRVDTLSELTQCDLPSLDDEYAAFLRVSDHELKPSLWPDESVLSLCLHKCPITDNSLSAVPKLPKLEWLDLTFTQVTDAGVGFLADTKSLRQASFEGTGISDKTLELLAQNLGLEELDLSSTGISDDGILALRSLVHLQTLWLTNTLVSDGVVPSIAAMQGLQRIDLRMTHVTESGRKQLQKLRPDLTIDPK